VPALFFFVGYFQDRVLRTICSVCLWTVILLNSASLAARITDVNRKCPADG
jgi:hypothetical protein